MESVDATNDTNGTSAKPINQHRVKACFENPERGCVVLDQPQQHWCIWSLINPDIVEIELALLKGLRSPSPQPSPAGEGAFHPVAAHTEATRFVRGGHRFSLAQRERAGVREKSIKGSVLTIGNGLRPDCKLAA